MWDWLKQVGESIVETGKQYQESGQLIDRLLRLPAPAALAELEQYVRTVDDQGFMIFMNGVGALAMAEEQRVQEINAAAQAESSWGGSFEDRMAQLMAGAGSGRALNSLEQQAIAEAQLRWQGLQALAFHAQRFRQGTRLEPEPAPAVPSAPPAAPPDQTQEGIEAVIAKLAESGQLPPDLLQQLSAAMNDPGAADQVLKALEGIGAAEVGSGPGLSIADHYRPGTGKFTLQWPLGVNLGALSFDELDRETQFHVLFQEWTRRELECSSLQDAGRLDEAEAVGHECLTRAGQLDVPELESRSHEAMMRIAQKRGDRPAEQQHARAALAARKNDDSPANEGLRRTLAMVDFEDGRIPEALAALDAIISRAGVPPDGLAQGRLGQALTDRATVNRFAHRWPEALADAKSAESIAQGLKPLPRQSILQTVHFLRAKLLADPLTPMHDLKAAEQSLVELRRIGFAAWPADELECEIAFQRKEWDSAATLADRVAEALSVEGWQRGAAAARLRAGKAYFELGDLASAAERSQSALDFFEQSGPPDLLAGARMLAARLRSSRREFDAAWSLALESLKGVEALIRSFRSPVEQQRFMLDKLDYYQHAFSIGLSQGGETGCLRAWSIAERAKSFYLCQLVANAEVPLFAGNDPKQQEVLAGLEIRLDALEAGLGRIPKSDQARRDVLEREVASVSAERSKLLGDIMQRNPRWATLRAPPVLDVGAELKQLDPSWSVVSYFWQERPTGATLHIFYQDASGTSRRLPVQWSQAELEALEAHAATLRGFVVPTVSLLPSTLIPKVLPEQLMAALAPGQRLLISPHRALQAIPLHAVPSSTGKRLIDDHPVQYVPTLGLLLNRPAARHDGSVVLLGCEQDGFGGPRLVDTPIEINRLNDLWSARRAGRIRTGLLSPDNSPDDVGLGPDQWSSCEYLHISCHGRFPPERPFDAALRLGNSAVRMSELFGTRLSASLVSLSACELGARTTSEGTLRFAGDEWLGMYLPLFYAGAATLLVSLWEANSFIAGSFMLQLNTALSEGQSPADAFRAAALSVSDNMETFWACWSLVGLPERPPLPGGTHA